MIEDDVKNLEIQVRQAGIILSQQQDQIKNLSNDLTRTKQWLEKLGDVSGLEWSQDATDWVDKSKLTELRKNPRTGKT